MKTIFDNTIQGDLVTRINTLEVSDQHLWGTMTVAQMVEHCIRWEEMMAGRRKIRRGLVGYLFGKMALKRLIGDDKPLPQRVPTFPELIVGEVVGRFDAQKEKWMERLGGYPDAAYFMHPFFGRMTREQTGRLAYKHTDHHLRQFGR